MFVSCFHAPLIQGHSRAAYIEKWYRLIFSVHLPFAGSSCLKTTARAQLCPADTDVIPLNHFEWAKNLPSQLGLSVDSSCECFMELYKYLLLPGLLIHPLLCALRAERSIRHYLMPDLTNGIPWVMPFPWKDVAGEAQIARGAHERGSFFRHGGRSIKTDGSSNCPTESLSWMRGEHMPWVTLTGVLLVQWFRCSGMWLLQWQEDIILKPGNCLSSGRVLTGN